MTPGSILGPAAPAGTVAQPGRQPQGDVQPGIARTGDHDRAAAPGGWCIHGVLHRYCPLPGEMAGPPIVIFPASVRLDPGARELISLPRLRAQARSIAGHVRRLTSDIHLMHAYNRRSGRLGALV